MLKSASTLKEFSTKIKSAQETLTPETVAEIAEEIMEVASVATELANEIAEGVPAGGEGEGRGDPLNDRNNGQPEQLEVAADETEEEKKKRLEKDAQDDKDEDKEKIKNLEASLAKLTREATLAKLAPKYASLFPQSLHESKLNEIINSKEPLNIVEAKIKEATSIITDKTMVKVASLNDSIYDLNTSDGEEVNISSVI